MKRYLLFCFDGYYPDGGWNDFAGDYDTIEEAKTYLRQDYWHIVDTQTRHVVACGNTK